MSDGLPALDAVYFDEAAETMPRDELEAIQLDAMLTLLPVAYERAPLVRATWDAAHVHPRDITSLDDFRAHAPFLDKHMLRRWRQEQADPYGGLLAVDAGELTAIMSTSGTTGDPTLVPEQWGRGSGPRAVMYRDFWGMGVRPGDHVALVLFTYRGPTYGFVQSLGAVPMLFDFTPSEMERFCELSLRFRPTALYNFGGLLMHAVREVCNRRGFDPRDVFSSYKAVVFAGEPLGPRFRALAREWDVELFEHSSVGDVTASFECGEHDGLHYWEDTAFVECLEPGTNTEVADGERGELVATTLVNRVAPLVRYRSDDIVRISREPCACGRTHARMWPIGRRSDEVVVDGKALLPIDVWAAVESVDACALGLFQIVRPQRDVERLRLRVGYANGWRDSLATVDDEVRAAVEAAVGVVPDVECVPEPELLRLGPPHKIPRVTPT